jgi:hypothetical protein
VIRWKHIRCCSDNWASHDEYWYVVYVRLRWKCCESARKTINQIEGKDSR